MNSAVSFESGAAWTVLVYMMANNDLEAAAVADMREMINAYTLEQSSPGFAAGKKVNVLVLIDRSETYSAEQIPGLGDFKSKSTKLVALVDGAFKELDALLPEQDMLKAETLQNFIATGLTLAPAEKTALVLWDHGAGGVVFKPLEKLLPENIEIHAFMPPGRMTRHREPALESVEALAAHAMEHIKLYLDIPFAMYGHSLGGKVAFECGRQLKKDDHADAQFYAVGVSAAPVAERKKKKIPPLLSLAQPSITL